MTVANESLNIFIRLIIFIFVPVLIICALLGLKLLIYSKNIKNKKSFNYTYRMDVSSLFVSTIICLSIFTIHLIFAINMSQLLIAENILKGKDIINLLILVSPILPGICFLSYFIDLIGLILKKEKLREEHRIQLYS